MSNMRQGPAKKSEKPEGRIKQRRREEEGRRRSQSRPEKGAKLS